MNKEIDISGIVLKTERLILRPWEETDLLDFNEYASVDGVGQMAGWLPHKNLEESKCILDMFIKERKTFALELEGKVIGSLGIDEYSEEEFPEFKDFDGRELGYVLSKNYWGSGLIPEAVREVIKFLLETVDLDFIICCHFTDNPQSMRVQEKCGFKHYKLIESETRYGIVKDSWASLLYKRAIPTGHDLTAK